MGSSAQWTWVCAKSWRQWRTGKPDCSPGCKESDMSEWLNNNKDPGSPLCGVYPKKPKILCLKDTCIFHRRHTDNSQDMEATYIFISRWTDSCVHSRILLSDKYNDILPFATTWINLECIMLDETGHPKKDKYCMLSLISTSSNTKYANEYSKIEIKPQIKKTNQWWPMGREKWEGQDRRRVVVCRWAIYYA